MASAMGASALGVRPTGHHREFGLAELLHPVEPGQFEREYRDRRELRIHRGDPGYYEHLFRLRDLDAVLVAMGAQPSLIRLVNDGRETPLIVSDGDSPGTATRTLFARYRDGATINILYLHERWPPLAQLCGALAADLTGVVHTNVYLTPGREQALRPHFDAHDVFVAQIHGTKHWRLYDSSASRLPAPGEKGQRVEGARQLTEFDMEPGDMLYLPRGTVHDATSNDGTSLHLTIGVSPVTWGAIAHRALDAVIARDARLREALPREIAGPDGWQAGVQDRVAAALTNAGAGVAAAPLVAEARRRLVAGWPAPFSGHLLDLETIASLDLDTPVRRRAGAAYSLTVDGGTVTLEFGGSAVRLPDRVLTELRAVAESRETTGRQLPGRLDGAGRLVLLRTLIREGFLTTQPAALTATDAAPR